MKNYILGILLLIGTGLQAGPWTISPNLGTFAWDDSAFDGPGTQKHWETTLVNSGWSNVKGSNSFQHPGYTLGLELGNKATEHWTFGLGYAFYDLGQQHIQATGTSNTASIIASNDRTLSVHNVFLSGKYGFRNGIFLKSELGLDFAMFEGKDEINNNGTDYLDTYKASGTGFNIGLYAGYEYTFNSNWALTGAIGMGLGRIPNLKVTDYSSNNTPNYKTGDVLLNTDGTQFGFSPSGLIAKLGVNYTF